MFRRKHLAHDKWFTRRWLQNNMSRLVGDCTLEMTYELRDWPHLLLPLLRFPVNIEAEVRFETQT